jgi:hypothetical protein
MLTTELTAFVNSMSYPSLVPSLSMLVKRISPAPRFSASLAHSTTSSPVGVLPPWIYASQVPSPLDLASIATTIHFVPNSCAPSFISWGLWTAGVQKDTLLAPAESIFLISSIVRIPPPTVKGIEICSAVRRTISSMVSRPSTEAVISRNTQFIGPGFIVSFS